MSSLEALQSRIGTVRELQSIVRTMKTLAAVAIRQFEKAAASVEEYYRTVEQGLAAVLRDTEGQALLAAPPAVPAAAGGPVALVVIGSDSGLCGHFNEDLARFAAGALRDRPGARLVAVGERACGHLEGLGLAVERCFHAPGTPAGITPLVQELLLHLEGWHAAGAGRIALHFNRQSRGEGYRPQEEPLLPVDLARFAHLGRERWPSRSLPVHTMERGALFAALLRQYLFVAVFRACAASLAAENAARLRAMQAADHNIDERLQELTARYRQERQDAITEELLDVVAGFEVLQGQDDDWG